jgi:hypothetical protein
MLDDARQRETAKAPNNEKFFVSFSWRLWRLGGEISGAAISGRELAYTLWWCFAFRSARSTTCRDCAVVICRRLRISASCNSPARTQEYPTDLKYAPERHAAKEYFGPRHRARVGR